MIVKAIIHKKKPVQHNNPLADDILKKVAKPLANPILH